MKNARRTEIAALLFSLSLGACTNMWGDRDNPVDASADNYQGYPSVLDPDDIVLASDWDGVYNAGSPPVFVCSKVVGATAYELALSSREDFSGTPEYDKASLTGNSYEADDLVERLAIGTTYYWRMRAYVDAWGAWSAARCFTRR